MRRVLSLFAGIEGFGLGLGATGGFEVTHAVELADFPREVIAARYPHVEVSVDVCEATFARGAFDTVCGGFPCQDLSLAGRGAGLAGARSGLWSEYARIIGEVEPELVLIENVPALLSRGFDKVLADLTGLGYSVEWDCLPAAAFGAWHLRDRVWIAAHRLGYPAVFGEPAADECRAPVDRGTEWRKWPRAGFALHAEGCVPLIPLAPLRDVKAGAVLPTPTATMGDRGGRGDLLQVVRGNTSPSGHYVGGVFPTPCSRDWKDNGENTDYEKIAAKGKLSGAAMLAERGMWPTPVVTDRTGTRNSTVKNRGERGGKGGAIGHTLTDAVTIAAAGEWPISPSEAARRQWPTPRAAANEWRTRGASPSHGSTHGKLLAGEVCDAEREAGRVVPPSSGGAGALNPAWVEWLMGFPVGWTDLDNGAPEHHSWLIEPADLPRVAENVARRRERLTALGNALVPPAAAFVGGRALAALDAELEDVAA